MTTVTVREYARLSTENIAGESLDRAQISISAFDWLCRLSSSFSASGAALVELENTRWLKLDNYVGVIETPCGTRLEILPKHVEGHDGIAASRALLRKMICAAMDLPVREAGEASLDRFDAPLSEWVMSRFLQALERLVKVGVRFDYKRVEAEECFLRGQLNAVAQMRQRPGRQHVFQIRHDIFVPDRPENRLLKLALDRVARLTQTPSNWRLAQELRLLLQGIPASGNIDGDFRAWRRDRLMAHYQSLRPWCELILYRQLPYSLVGNWHGITILFPMEKLFERYVAAWLRKVLATDATLRAQAASQYLCEHDGDQMFRLEPDLLVEQGEKRWVLDTKWKRLDNEKSNKYGLSQSDIYQLFAYGHRYLGGIGDLFLIYPRTLKFDLALPMFDLQGGMRLWVVPFDMNEAHIERPYLLSLPLRDPTNKYQRNESD
jgi:5-methylcytosine-specific restriction enzyme subunit McrC